MNSRTRPLAAMCRLNAKKNCSSPPSRREAPKKIAATVIEIAGHVIIAIPRATASTPDTSADFQKCGNRLGGAGLVIWAVFHSAARVGRGSQPCQEVAYRWPVAVGKLTTEGCISADGGNAVRALPAPRPRRQRWNGASLPCFRHRYRQSRRPEGAADASGGDHTFRQRFLREARVAAALTEPHVVPI